MPAPLKAADIFDLTGEVALVTGASSGLGARFARVLAANGAKVVLAARRTDRIAALADEIKASGGSALAVACDVTDTASVEAAFDAAERAFGLVTVAIANAGITDEGRAQDIDDERWRSVLDVNLDGVFKVARAAGRRLIAAKRPGSVVVTASILGIGVSKGLVAYNTSKAAAIQLTRSLAVEWIGRGIRVNAIAPGYFQTEINAGFLETDLGKRMVEQIPARRTGGEGDLDGPLLLLAAPRASGFMAGAVIVVDGGQVLPIT